jgi:tRNA-Thr(GGU) m(6)t(6)A37 methyltransferase TsaA
MEVIFRPIAKIRTDYSSKFAVPRQSGLAQSEGVIVFEKEYRDENALKEIEGFSHLWLLWYFSQSDLHGEFKPTVRPPKLGGNKRVGVFATRSPYRPNPIGLSVVELVRKEKTPLDGVVLVVKGADLVDGTPIFDIKPYLPFSDCVTTANGGFTDEINKVAKNVEFALDEPMPLTDEQVQQLIAVLALDPRPGYKTYDDRVYGFEWQSYNVRFTVSPTTVTVVQIKKI